MMLRLKMGTTSVFIHNNGMLVVSQTTDDVSNIVWISRRCTVGPARTLQLQMHGPIESMLAKQNGLVCIEYLGVREVGGIGG
jgi:hypothetical protein